MTEKRSHVSTPAGQADAFEHRPNGPGPFPGVLLFSDAFGPRDAVHTVAARFAERGFYVVVPDLFYRAKPYGPFDARTAFQDEAVRPKVMALVGSLTPEVARPDVGAYLDALAKNPDVKKGGVGIVGYCMGGLLAIRAAEWFPERVAAVAAVHAGRLVTDAPDSAHLAVDRIRAKVYVAAADNDRSFTDQQRQTFADALAKAGVRHEIELYAGALHGFALPDTHVYDPAASERHLARVTRLFEETLR